MERYIQLLWRERFELGLFLTLLEPGLGIKSVKYSDCIVYELEFILIHIHFVWYRRESKYPPYNFNKVLVGNNIDNFGITFDDEEVGLCIELSSSKIFTDDVDVVASLVGINLLFIGIYIVIPKRKVRGR